MKVMDFLIILALAAPNFGEATNTALYTTPKLPDNILANGFSGLVVTAKNVNTQSNIDVFYGENLEQPKGTVFSWINHLPRSFEDEDEGVSVTSHLDGNGFCTVIATFYKPLTNGTFGFKIRAWDGFYELSKITVKDCPQSIAETNISVQALSFTYGSRGVFNCENLTDGKLFSKNGKPISSNTTCGYDAKWEETDEIDQCSTAPEVELIGNTSVAEGENLTLVCLKKGEPKVNTTYLLFINNSLVISSSENNFTLQNINRSYNNVEVYCQVSNTFTKTYNNTGRSEIRNITVLLISASPGEQKNEPPTHNTWIIGVVVGVMALIALSVGVYCWWKRRQREERPPTDGRDPFNDEQNINLMNGNGSLKEDPNANEHETSFGKKHNINLLQN